MLAKNMATQDQGPGMGLIFNAKVDGIANCQSKWGYLA